MLELALVLPVVMALLLGMITGGIAYFKKISLVDAVREGARYGASLKWGTLAGSTPAQQQATWVSDVQNRVAQLAPDLIQPSQVCAALVIPPTGSDMSCGVPDPIGATTDPLAGAPASIVKVSVAMPAQLQFFFFAPNVTITAFTADRYERDIL
jgi:hypothetical protein